MIYSFASVCNCKGNGIVDSEREISIVIIKDVPMKCGAVKLQAITGE